MRLYWTPSQEVSGAKASGKYLPHTETISLPEEFWSDLKQIFGLLIQSRLAELTFDQPGHYVADKLAPLIEQVRALVQKSEGVWNSETLAGVRFSLANALQIEGEQAGDQELFAEVIELYRKVFDEWTRERVPRNWAATQMNSSAMPFGTAAEPRAGRRRSRRRSTPIAKRSRNGPASARRSIGQ